MGPVFNNTFSAGFAKFIFICDYIYNVEMLEGRQERNVEKTSEDGFKFHCVDQRRIPEAKEALVVINKVSIIRMLVTFLAIDVTGNARGKAVQDFL